MVLMTRKIVLIAVISGLRTVFFSPLQNKICLDFDKNGPNAPKSKTLAGRANPSNGLD